jgi:hypothetical protein
MKICRGLEVYLPPFLSLALASRPGRFTPEEIAHSTYWIGGCLCPRADIDVVGKRKILPLPVFEPWPSNL